MIAYAMINSLGLNLVNYAMLCYLQEPVRSPPSVDRAVVETPPTRDEDSLTTPQVSKRKRDVSSVSSSVLSSATQALDMIVSRMSQPQQQRTVTDHIYLFFQSLPSQFRFVPTERQPTVMLELQQVVTNGQLPSVSTAQGNTLTYQQL